MGIKSQLGVARCNNNVRPNVYRRVPLLQTGKLHTLGPHEQRDHNFTKQVGVRTLRVEVKRLANTKCIEVGGPRLQGARQQIQLQKGARIVFAVRKRNPGFQV